MILLKFWKHGGDRGWKTGVLKKRCRTIKFTFLKRFLISYKKYRVLFYLLFLNIFINFRGRKNNSIYLETKQSNILFLLHLMTYIEFQVKMYVLFKFWQKNGSFSYSTFSNFEKHLSNLSQFIVLCLNIIKNTCYKEERNDLFSLLKNDCHCTTNNEFNKRLQQWYFMKILKHC